MPLDNTATIKDIIAQFESLQGINAKADLASVVGSPATADDSMATINSVIQSAKNELADKIGGSASGTQPLQALVGNLAVGKKWASGTIPVSGSNAMVVNGLDFQPTFVIMWGKRDGFTQVWWRTYIDPSLSHLPTMTTDRINNIEFMNSGTTTYTPYTNVFNVSSDGFSTTSQLSNGITYDWIAFE